MDQYFKTLNLKWGASLEEAKRAYREQAKIWHPDRFPSHSDALQKKAHDRFQKVSEAFQKIEEFHNSRSRVRWADQQPFTDITGSGGRRHGFRTPNTQPGGPPYGPDDEVIIGASPYQETEGIGYVTRTWPNGDVYEGQVVNEQMHGMGVFVSAAGDIYVGQFKFGKPDGYGKMDFANGDRYEGEFRQDAMEGKGTYSYANGDRFVGYFKQDQPHGQGAFIVTDGQVYAGEWDQGVLLAD